MTPMKMMRKVMFPTNNVSVSGKQVNKPKESCHTVEGSFAQRLYKGFFKNHSNKLQQAQSKRGAIRYQCLLKQTWGIKTQCNSSYIFLHLSCSPASPCLSTSLTNMSLEETNCKQKKKFFALSTEAGNITDFFVFHLEKRVSSVFLPQFKKKKKEKKRAGSHHHNL